MAAKVAGTAARVFAVVTVIYLIERSPPIVHEWQAAFADCPEVQPMGGDYFQRSADAIVSPANSFGIMDGGLNLAIRDQDQILPLRMSGRDDHGRADMQLTATRIARKAR